MTLSKRVNGKWVPVANGTKLAPVKVGECFRLLYHDKEHCYRTFLVQDIVRADSIAVEFKTINSTYLLT